MVTRSQALAKRKAEEEVARPRSKSSRSTPSDDNSPNRKQRSKRPARKQRSVRPIEEEENEDSGKENAAERDENLGSIAVPETSPPAHGADHGGNASNGVAATKDDEESRQRERLEKEKQDFPTAKELAKQLQLIIERRRAFQQGITTSGQAATHLESILRLCELASPEEMQSNIYLLFFRQGWWNDLRNLREQFEDLREAEKRVEQQSEVFEKFNETYDALVARRGAIVLGDEGGTGDPGPDLNQRIVQAREDLRKAQNDFDVAQKDLSQRRVELDAAVTQSLDEGERMLVQEGYLRRWVDDRSQLGNEARSDQGSEVQVENRALTPATLEQDYHQAQQRQPDPDESFVVEDLAAGFRQEQRDELERTRQAYSDATKKFHAVRNGYYRRLVSYLTKRQGNTAGETQTDFDNRYFLTRNRANRELVAARDMHHFAIEEADKTGALSVGQRAWLYGDEADSGRGSGDGRIVQVLADLRKARIEAWLWDEGQDETVSEQHWGDLLSDRSQKGKSLGGFTQWSEDQGKATGKRRRLIDEWRQEQDRVRRKTAFAVLPSTFPPGAELQWHEGWNGL